MIRYYLNLLYCRKYDSSTWYWCIIRRQQVTSLLHINVRRYSRGCKRISNYNFCIWLMHQSYLYAGFIFGMRVDE